jgi:hypothetical protein
MSTQPTQTRESIDPETEAFLERLAFEEKIKASRLSGVRTVLVVLAAQGMVYDRESLRQKIRAAYRDAAVFFRTTQGTTLGPAAPGKVDLMIDMTGPGSFQWPFYARKLRRMARVAVGRNAGPFRKRIYDKVVDEKSRMQELPKDPLTRERVVQREVLALAGVAMEQTGELPADLGKTIALNLPPLQRL